MTLPKDPTEFNRPTQKILDDADLDGLGRAVMTLCQELWVVKDRMAILEAVLEESDLDVEKAVETFQPDEALQEKLNRDGRELVERVLGALNSAS